MKALLLSIMIWLGVVTPPQPVIIDGYDPGGQVGTYLLMWERIAQTGALIVLDGACISACTLVLAEIPADRICVTPRASLGLHQAANSDTGEADKEVTLILQTTFYPTWLQDWIKAYEAENGGLTLEVVYVRYEELSKHYRTCTAIEAPVGGTEV
jgi:ABC-type glycerol-3-phosphate transport system substrate-binding protein